MKRTVGARDAEIKDLKQELAKLRKSFGGCVCVCVCVCERVCACMRVICRKTGMQHVG